MVRPKPKFILAMDERRAVSEWVGRLNISYGYCSNFWNIANLNDAKFSHMKSHHCHAFMKTLLLIAFGAFPDDLLKLLIKIS